MHHSKPDLLAIVGPTAVGKTELTIDLAKSLAGEIVSADSMQIYRHMDVGTAKPSLAERQGIPHHMIDIVDPTEDYSVAQYQHEAEQTIREISSRGKVPILSGGTGLYMRAVVDDYLFEDEGRDEELRARLAEEAATHGNVWLHEKLARVDPQSAERLHPNDVRRVIRALEVYHTTGSPLSAQQTAAKSASSKFNATLIGLTRDRQVLYDRINYRVDLMMSAGLVEEVKTLLEAGVSPGNTAMQGIGYRQIVAHLKGEYELTEAVDLIKRDTRRYAKRQYTWFKRDPRIVWINLEMMNKQEAVARILGLFRLNNTRFAGTMSPTKKLTN